MAREQSTGAGTDPMFDQARTYFEDGNFDESLKILTSLADLQPQNAEYLAWQARVYRAKEIPGAFEIADAAIKVNENQPLAYAVRGAIHADQQEYAKAIQDLTKAIELDPKNYFALVNRAESYEKIGDFKQAIVDLARSYDIKISLVFPTGNVFHSAEQHLHESLIPTLEGVEKYVGFWPGVIYWGLEERETLFGGYTMTDLYGTGGTGYICLTDKHIRIVSLAQLTQQLSPIPQKRGGLAGFFLPTHYHDKRQVETKDRTWTVPHASITEVRLTKPTGFSDDVKFVKLTTTVENWEIFTHPPEYVLTALEMARTGELPKIWGEGETGGRLEEEIFALIERLAKLKQKGAISAEDFEAKKKDLLSRL